MATDATNAAEPSRARVLAGGVLMGLANLVPGVSGGTMILALGLYDTFISWVADLTGMRWSRRLFTNLFVFGGGLAIAVLALAGPAVWAVTHHRWVMYSLFLGMTLGGVPAIWRALRPLRAVDAVAVAAGLGAMVAFVFALEDTSVGDGPVALSSIGALASSSMILPGISGSLVLLVFGLYDTVIGAMSVGALREDPGASLGILVPFAIGVAAGIAGLSNVLKVLLHRAPGPTHGALLGLLFGSVLPLYPFQEPVHPELLDKPERKAIAALVEGADPVAVADEFEVVWDDARVAEVRERYAGMSGGDLKRLSQETAAVRPSLARLLGALTLFAVGLACTSLLGGGRGKADVRDDTRP